MRRLSKGFTVIELVVALTIVCLLVAVAVASYQDHMTRKVRTQAGTALLDSADFLRVHSQRTGSFLGATLPVTQVPGSGEADYYLSLAATPVNGSDPQGTFPATGDQNFTLQAVPVGDDACGILLLDQDGRIGVTGIGAKAGECWGR